MSQKAVRLSRNNHTVGIQLSHYVFLYSLIVIGLLIIFLQSFLSQKEPTPTPPPPHPPPPAAYLYILLFSQHFSLEFFVLPLSYCFSPNFLFYPVIVDQKCRPFFPGAWLQFRTILPFYELDSSLILFQNLYTYP